jgi:hypothetical protein
MIFIFKIPFGMGNSTANRPNPKGLNSTTLTGTTPDEKHAPHDTPVEVNHLDALKTQLPSCQWIMVAMLLLVGFVFACLVSSPQVMMTWFMASVMTLFQYLLSFVTITINRTVLFAMMTLGMTSYGGNKSNDDRNKRDDNKDVNDDKSKDPDDQSKDDKSKENDKNDVTKDTGDPPNDKGGDDKYGKSKSLKQVLMSLKGDKDMFVKGSLIGTVQVLCEQQKCSKGYFDTLKTICLESPRLGKLVLHFNAATGQLPTIETKLSLFPHRRDYIISGQECVHHQRNDKKTTVLDVSAFQKLVFAKYMCALEKTGRINIGDIRPLLENSLGNGDLALDVCRQLLVQLPTETDNQLKVQDFTFYNRLLKKAYPESKVLQGFSAEMLKMVAIHFLVCNEQTAFSKKRKVCPKKFLTVLIANINTKLGLSMPSTASLEEVEKTVINLFPLDFSLASPLTVDDFIVSHADGVEISKTELMGAQTLLPGAMRNVSSVTRTDGKTWFLNQFSKEKGSLSENHKRFVNENTKLDRKQVWSVSYKDTKMWTVVTQPINDGEWSIILCQAIMSDLKNGSIIIVNEDKNSTTKSLMTGSTQIQFLSLNPGFNHIESKDKGCAKAVLLAINAEFKKIKKSVKLFLRLLNHFPHKEDAEITKEQFWQLFEIAFGMERLAKFVELSQTLNELLYDGFGEAFLHLCMVSTKAPKNVGNHFVIRLGYTAKTTTIAVHCGSGAVGAFSATLVENIQFLSKLKGESTYLQRLNKTLSELSHEYARVVRYQLACAAVHTAGATIIPDTPEGNTLRAEADPMIRRLAEQYKAQTSVEMTMEQKVSIASQLTNGCVHNAQQSLLLTNEDGTPYLVDGKPVILEVGLKGSCTILPGGVQIAFSHGKCVLLLNTRAKTSRWVAVDELEELRRTYDGFFTPSNAEEVEKYLVMSNVVILGHGGGRSCSSTENGKNHSHLDCLNDVMAHTYGQVASESPKSHRDGYKTLADIVVDGLVVLELEDFSKNNPNRKAFAFQQAYDGDHEAFVKFVLKVFFPKLWLSLGKKSPRMSHRLQTGGQKTVSYQRLW